MTIVNTTIIKFETKGIEVSSFLGSWTLFVLLLGNYHMEKAERVIWRTIFDFIRFEVELCKGLQSKSLLCARIVRSDSRYSRGFHKILLSFHNSLFLEPSADLVHSTENRGFKRLIICIMHEAR